MTRREARAWLIFQAVCDGNSSRKIAAELGVSVRLVQAEAAWARRQLDACVQNRRHLFPPLLVVGFPCGPYTPTTRCNHDVEPIRVGSVFCCGVCWRSGQDGHPYFVLDPRVDEVPRRRAGRTPCLTPKPTSRRS